MPAPHIAIVATLHSPGDVRVFQRWTCGLAARGWRVSLLAPLREVRPEDVHPPPGAAYYPVAEVGGYVQRLLKAGRVLPRLRELQPDIVLAVDPELLPTLLRYRAASRAAVVFDRHEPFDEPGALVRGGALARFIAAAYARYERFAAPRLDGVVVVLDEMTSHLAPGTNVITAHNYATRQVLAQLAGAPGPGTPSYTCINLGVQLALRGFHHLLELARVMVRERGRTAFTLALGGRFEEGGYELAQDFRRQHGLEENLILYPDFLPHAEAVSLFRAAQIGLTPLLDNATGRTSLQNKVVEFMAAGLPVITSPASLNGEYVAAAGCGALHWADDTAGIADVIEDWMDNPAQARELGRRGREYALAHLAWEGELDRVEPWLKQLIARRQAR